MYIYIYIEREIYIYNIMQHIICYNMTCCVTL